MASGRISKAELKCVGKTITVPANAASVDVTADTIDGYTFTAWLAVATNGWIGSAYLERPQLSSTAAWVYGGPTAEARDLYVTALYSKL